MSSDDEEARARGGAADKIRATFTQDQPVNVRTVHGPGGAPATTLVVTLVFYGTGNSYHKHGHWLMGWLFDLAEAPKHIVDGPGSGNHDLSRRLRKVKRNAIAGAGCQTPSSAASKGTSKKTTQR